ncbi:MAG: hypothetical protein V3S69_01105, partial [Dehalococcoidales bacterium]
MVRAIIKSALKDTIEGLPDDFVIKSESALNVLKKRGVKDEELKFSGVQEQLGQAKGKMTKKQLQGFLEADVQGPEAARLRKEADAFAQNTASGMSESMRAKLAGSVLESAANVPFTRVPRTQFKTFDDPEKTYRSYSMPQALKDGSRYQEKILQFTEALNPERWRNPAHFEDTPDYLLHTRVYRDTIDGKETHVIQEIQSDLQQGARQQADQPVTLAEGESSVLREFLRAGDSAEDQLLDDTLDILRNSGFGLEADPFIAAEQVLRGSKGIPDSPYQKNWLRKGMEREVADAVNQGREQIAIPIKGEGVGSLVRGQGVQKWYETQVLSTAKKLAKSIGGEFKLFSPGGKQLVAKDPSASEFGLADKYLGDLFDFAGEETDQDVLKWLNNNFDGDATLEQANRLRTAEGLEGVNAVMREFAAGGGTEYAVIIPPAGKDLSFSLYTPGSAGVFGAYMAIKAGNEPEDVKQFLMDDREFSEEEADSALARITQVQGAIDAGYSEDEVRQFLSANELPYDSSQQTFSPEPVADTEEQIQGAFDLLTQPSVSAGAASESTGVDENGDLIRASDLVAKLQTITRDNGDIIRAGHGLFSPEAARDAETISRANIQNIVNLASKRGVELTYEDGEFVIQTPQGPAVVTPSLWQEVLEAKGEIFGGISGGIAGGIAGAQVPVPHPLLKAGTIVAGSVIGAATGSVLGTEMDYMMTAMELQEEFDSQLAMRKAVNTAAISAVMDVGGLGIFKLGKFGYRSVQTAFRMMKDGNTAGAHKALKETLFLSD